MANLPPISVYDSPSREDILYGTGNATGNVSVGDYLIYSGHRIIPTAIAANLANLAAVKASAVGVSLGANPVYDSHGVTKQNTALLYMRQGRFPVSAFNNMSASADVVLGTPVYPASTGSAVSYPTGMTGVGAQWATASKVSISGVVGSASASAAVAGAAGIATIVGVRQWGTGSGTTQLDILLEAVRPDYY